MEAIHVRLGLGVGAPRVAVRETHAVRTQEAAL